MNSSGSPVKRTNHSKYWEGGILFLVGLRRLHPSSFSTQAVVNTASCTPPVFQCAKVEGMWGFAGVRRAEIGSFACTPRHLDRQISRWCPCFFSELFYQYPYASLSRTPVSASKLASFANYYVPEEWFWDPVLKCLIKRRSKDSPPKLYHIHSSCSVILPGLLLRTLLHQV